jgi:L-lactate dehydrogenase complex protein LldG
MLGQAEFGQLARASSLCGACMEVCPVAIDLPKLLLRVRAGGLELRPQNAEKNIPIHVNWGLRFYSWIASDPRRFTAALKLAGFFSRILSPRSDWLRLPGFTGWGYSKYLPRPAQRPFRERWEELQLAEDRLIAPRESENNGQNKSKETNRTQPGDRGTMIERFRSQLMALDGSFTSCRMEDLSQLVFDKLNELNTSAILTWESEQLPMGLTEDLIESGISISEDFNPQVKVGLTGTLAAIAETGTLVLTSGAGRAQFVSLIPEIHLVVLRASDIHQELSEILQQREVKEASSVALISGPSRTADIEMTLTIGVHGPGQVHVFCLEDT